MGCDVCVLYQRQGSAGFLRAIPSTALLWTEISDIFPGICWGHSFSPKYSEDSIDNCFPHSLHPLRLHSALVVLQHHAWTCLPSCCFLMSSLMSFILDSGSDARFNVFMSMASMSSFGQCWLAGCSCLSLDFVLSIQLNPWICLLKPKLAAVAEKQNKNLQRWTSTAGSLGPSKADSKVDSKADFKGSLEGEHTLNGMNSESDYLLRVGAIYCWTHNSLQDLQKAKFSLWGWTTTHSGSLEERAGGATDESDFHTGHDGQAKSADGQLTYISCFY